MSEGKCMGDYRTVTMKDAEFCQVHARLNVFCRLKSSQEALAQARKELAEARKIIAEREASLSASKKVERQVAQEYELLTDAESRLKEAQTLNTALLAALNDLLAVFYKGEGKHLKDVSTEELWMRIKNIGPAFDPANRVKTLLRVREALSLHPPAALRRVEAVERVVEDARLLGDCHCDHHEGPDYGICTYRIKKDLDALDALAGEARP